jgi:hypothetical protein
MTRMNHLAAVCFCAGLLGALVSSLALWLAGAFGTTAWAGIDFAPVLTLDWLNPRLLSGGLWGLLLVFLFATPRRRNGWIRKGLWFSLLPSAVQLLYVFPYATEHGLFGMGLGTFTPLLILACNALWGASASVCTRLLWGRG